MNTSKIYPELSLPRACRKAPTLTSSEVHRAEPVEVPEGQFCTIAVIILLTLLLLLASIIIHN